MKTKIVKLQVVDLDETLHQEIKHAFAIVAASPRQRTGEKFVARLNRRLGPLNLHDWRDVAVKFLRRKFPKFYIYRGGSHIAIHSSPPNPPIIYGPNSLRIGEAGRCLARIVEC